MSTGRFESIDEEVSALQHDGVTPKELAESRQYMIGRCRASSKPTPGIAQFLQAAEFFNLGLDYDVRLPELLGAVTLDDVHGVAEKYLDMGHATIVVAGPYAG